MAFTNQERWSTASKNPLKIRPYHGGSARTYDVESIRRLGAKLPVSCSMPLPTSHELNVLQQALQTIHTAADMYGQHLESIPLRRGNSTESTTLRTSASVSIPDVSIREE
jgi:hypothetical protein